MHWQPIKTAPRDGTWVLGLNNRGNCAVIIWSDAALRDGRDPIPGWIHPFSDGSLSSFWNGANGSLPVAWSPLPADEELKSLLLKFGGNEPLMRE